MTAVPAPTDPDDAFEADLTGFPLAVDEEGLGARQGIEVAVTRFTDEIRQGKAPTIDGYCRNYPHLKEELLELLPLVLNLEQWSVDKEVECVRGAFPENFTLEEIGRYRIVREMGRGGMGIVFEGVERETGEVFAIKLLPLRHVADLEQRQDVFRREAATIARLRHPHIVPVHSFGNFQGYTYYVMQLIEGVSLDQVLRHLRETQAPVCITDLLPPTSAAQHVRSSDNLPLLTLPPNGWKAFAKIGVQVAVALAHAHRKHVLHNDIKPANLLVDRTGHVTVTDFGVGQGSAQSASEQDTHAPGTLRYMAPERFSGQYDARSDLYSLGATLYELITQTPVYEATERQALVKLVISTSPRRPRDINPQIPVTLERIVMKALARDPALRFRSADELRAELLRFINDRPIRTRGPSWWRRLWGK